MLPRGNEAIPSLRDDDHSTVGCFFLQRSSGRSYLGRRARQHHAVWAHEHRNSAARFTRENILASFRRRARRFRWRVSPQSPRTGKSVGCQSPFAKIFRFTEYPNQMHIRCRPVPSKGAARDRHDTWSGMWWTWNAPLTNGADPDGQVVWS
jgi:hypothetical protein